MLLRTKVLLNTMALASIKTFLKRLSQIILFIIVLVFLIPGKLLIPVKGATNKNWDKRSYWFYPWGNSITHKGIDIFAIEKSEVISPTYSIVIETGENPNGGKYIYLLGPKFRTMYFAHLDTILVTTGSILSPNQIIGLVGNTGNAHDKPPHLHFSVFSLIPYPWLYERNKPEGWKRMFYLNPERYF